MKAAQLVLSGRPPPVSLRALPPSRRCCQVAATGNAGGQQGSAVDSQALLQRAAALRAQQEALEREAAQLAAALEGLPAAEQRAVLEALGAQRRAQQQGSGPTNGQSASQQQQQAEGAQQQTQVQQDKQQQQQEDEQQQPTAGAAAEGERAPVGWEAALPPELQQVIRDAGMEPTLRQHAEAVRAAVGEEGEATGAGSAEEVEAIARMIEEGEELPPLVPDDYWDGPPEPGDQFVARVQGSVDYVNTDLKGSKHFKPPPPDPALSPEDRAALAAAEAAAREHTSSALVVHRALEYSRVPELAAAYARGWETAKEVDRQWHTIKAESSVTQQEEVPKSVPPPTIPPEAEREFKAAERVAYVLRRAHKDSTDPAAPLLALQEKGLLSDDFVLEDPFQVSEGPESALDYMERLRLAGATLQNLNIMCRCLRYEPRMVWSATLDCLINLPYPAWFYRWHVLNRGAQQQQQARSAAGNRTAGAAAAGLAAVEAASAGAPEPAGSEAGAQRATAAALAARGPLAGISAADCDALLESKRLEEQRQWVEDFKLLSGMLRGAKAAAEAAGQPLDDKAKLGVLMAGADTILRRKRQEFEARQAELAAAEDELAAADAAMWDQQERWWQALAEGGPAAEAARVEFEAAMAAAEAPADQLPPPRLAGVHSEPYEFEGQRREHRWVFLDYEQQERQRGRQQFDLYPRNPHGGAAAAAEDAAACGEEGEEDWQEMQARVQARQQRQFSLLPPAAELLQQEWGSQDSAAPQQPQAQQAEQQPPPAAQQQRQQQAAPADAGSAGSKKKRRQGSRERQQARKGQQDAAGDGDGDASEVYEKVFPPLEEELFPFTFDIEKQQARRRAGRILRGLLGDNFETVMAQLPKRGARKGRNSNAALALEEDQEGTQWLGGECMTVNATFLYTIDTAGSGQVLSCTITWGSVHGLGLPEVTDAFDVWVEATGMLHDAECDADDEIRAALQEQEGGWDDGGWDGGGGDSGGVASAAVGGADGLERGSSWLPLWLM